jgi:hypothetical protein
LTYPTLKDQNLSSDAANLEVYFLTKLHQAEYHDPRGSYQVYAIKKPSPWQGKSTTRRRTPYARATPPDRSGTTRTGTMEHGIPSPRDRSISARLGSAHVKANRRHPASHAIYPRPPVLPPRRGEHARTARSAGPARASPPELRHSSLSLCNHSPSTKHEPSGALPVARSCYGTRIYATEDG